MIEVEDDRGELRAADVEKNEVNVRVEGWEPGGRPADIGRSIDATVAGRATGFRFPSAFVSVITGDADRWRTFSGESDPLWLEANDHLIQVEANVVTYLRFEGEATLRRESETDTIHLDFPAPTPVTLGFRSRVRRPRHRITVPPTAEGVATALSHLPSALETTTPDRSYPSLRNHPPTVEIGGAYSIPHAIRDSRPETGLELLLPPELPWLFVTAPLAYYTQASVRVDPGATPQLRAGSAGAMHEFAPFPDVQSEVAGLLRRCFFLDCLVRNAGPFGTDLSEFELLERIGLDPREAYDASPTERLRQYLDAPFDDIGSELPDWHLSMYIDPDVEHVPVLPHLLDRLSAIYLPRASDLGSDELLDRSLNDFYRTPSARVSGGAPRADPVLPDFGRGRFHGWIADGIPVDAFKTPPIAFENRFRYSNQGTEPITITVVLNDGEMDDEQSAVERLYRERASELSIEVEIERGLAHDELAAVFEGENDFVHYIGHCEEAGFVCSDRHLSVSELSEVNTQLFFLNACGSYQQGIELIEKGSIAGGVTLNTVLDDPATTVGTTFARLIINGFSIAQSLRLACRQIMMNKNYAIVGDGTHTLAQGDDQSEVINKIKNKEAKIIEIEPFSINEPGGCFQPHLDQSQEMYLYGNSATFEISRSDLLNYLSHANAPVIYENEFYWSDELFDRISNHGYK